MERLYPFRFNFRVQDEDRRDSLRKGKRASQRERRRSAGLKPILSSSLAPEVYLTSESMIDSTNFVLMPLPLGERVLLVSDGSSTVASSSSGSYLCSFSSLLPGASVLECVFSEDQFFARDILAWRGESTTHLPAMERFQLLSENVQSLLPVLPVFTASSENFASALIGKPVAFYHAQAPYGIQCYKWTEGPTDGTVILLCNTDGQLLTSDGKILHKLPPRLLCAGNLRCVVSGAQIDGNIEHVDVIAPASHEEVYSWTQVLTEAAGIKPCAREIQETLASGRLAQVLHFNSSTASSQDPTEATDLFFK